MVTAAQLARTGAQKRQAAGIVGLSELRKKLRAMPAAVRQPVVDAVQAGAEEIRFEQLSRVAVAEGDLAASIEIKFGRDRLSAKIGPGARTKKAKRRGGWRAKFIEFGTRHSPAQPFARIALERKQRKIGGDIGRAVKGALRQVARGGR